MEPESVIEDKTIELMVSERGSPESRCGSSLSPPYSSLRAAFAEGGVGGRETPQRRRQEEEKGGERKEGEAPARWEMVFVGLDFDRGAFPISLFHCWEGGGGRVSR